MQDEIADVGAKLGGANGLWRGGAGTAGVATMLAEADLVVFCSAASLQDVVRDRATRYPYASAAQRIFVNTVPGGWPVSAAANLHLRPPVGRSPTWAAARSRDFAADFTFYWTAICDEQASCRASRRVSDCQSLLIT